MVQTGMPRNDFRDRVSELQVRARHSVARFKQLELQRYQEALRAFEDVERFDPDLANLAIEILKGRGNAVSWFAAHIDASDIAIPWQCIAEGKADWVRKALMAAS
jgi:hypothetical protein